MRFKPCMRSDCQQKSSWTRWYHLKEAWTCKLSPARKPPWTRSAWLQWLHPLNFLLRCLRSRWNLQRCTRFWLEWTLRYDECLFWSWVDSSAELHVALLSCQLSIFHFLMFSGRSSSGELGIFEDASHWAEREARCCWNELDPPVEVGLWIPLETWHQLQLRILWFCSKVLEYKLGFEGLKQSSAWNDVLRSGNSAEARNIIGVANSILASGYKLEETICSRDAKWGMNVLRFGDGMKRGLAVKLLCLSLIVFLHCFELHSHVTPLSLIKLQGGFYFEKQCLTPLSLIKLQGGFYFEKQCLVMDISKKILMRLLYLSHWLGCPPSMRLTSTWLSKQCVKMWKGPMSNPFRAFSGLI